EEQSRGLIILFTSSMTVIRETRDRCNEVRKILQTHRVFFDERDVYISEENALNLIKRLKLQGGMNEMRDDEKIQSLNESGVLRKIFKDFKKVEDDMTCGGCGGYKYTPCYTCRGSKKSTVINSPISPSSSSLLLSPSSSSTLKCTKCDENGLVRCKYC
ncbi:hypothetical protein HELRODRAFT_126000, partial [Helobdella robusta]|uniref:Glutaredoxin domain-containing protein n=1 Tax=Helobdella robusta TaxID=6412 RepID=T1EH80_HELRO